MGNNMTKVAIIVYGGRVGGLGESIKKGVEASGVECTIFSVAETLPADIAPPKSKYPVIKAADMEGYDGFMFGLSGRYGMMPTQMKNFVDTTGALWQGGKLVGKTAGCFFSTGTQGGGQETLGLTTVTFFAHLGLLYVPLGYIDPALMSFEETHGGSPYGCGTFAGPDGSREISALEKGLGESQGKHFGTVTAKQAS